MLYCHLQIKPLEKIDFSFNWKETLLNRYPGLLCIEADHHSDTFLTQESSKLILQSDQIIGFFDMEESDSIGSLSGILEALRRAKGKKLIFVKGSHQMLERALLMLNSEVIAFENEEQLLKEVDTFFNT